MKKLSQRDLFTSSDLWKRSRSRVMGQYCEVLVTMSIMCNNRLYPRDEEVMGTFKGGDRGKKAQTSTTSSQ